VLIGVDNHPLKETFKQRIMDTFLSQKTEAGTTKWLPLFSQILQPINFDITERLKDLT
jgi:hypothetical protein